MGVPIRARFCMRIYGKVLTVRRLAQNNCGARDLAVDNLGDNLVTVTPSGHPSPFAFGRAFGVFLEERACAISSEVLQEGMTFLA